MTGAGVGAGALIAGVPLPAPAPVPAVSEGQSENAAPKTITRLAAENLNWAVATFAGELYAGAEIDNEARTVRLFTSPSFASLGEKGSATTAYVLTELERRLDLLGVSEATGMVAERDHSDTYTLEVYSAPRSANEMLATRDLLISGPGAGADKLEEWRAGVADRLRIIRANPKSGVVELGVFRLTDDDRRVAASVLGDDVHLYEFNGTVNFAAQANDGAPHYGSAGIKRQKNAQEYKFCSSGFTVTDKNGNRAMLTAGHCGTGAFTAINSSTSFGSTSQLQYGTAPNYYDFQSLSGSTYSPRFYKSNGATVTMYQFSPVQQWQNSTSSYPVTGTGLPGTTVVANGAHFGSYSYTTTGVSNFCASDGVALVCGLSEANRLGSCPNGPGDSGGAVSAPSPTGGNSAVGSANGVAEQDFFGGKICYFYFTPIAIIANSLNVSVVLA